MNILSLFDGMSCGQLALTRAGIPITTYYASEIDKHAISVTQHNFPKTIQLGDVTKVTCENLPKIDILIGGSPCTGFSSVGKKLNFDDPQSKLFFEYVRIMEEVKPKYFFLENVRMAKKHQNVISEILRVEPVFINSEVVSAHNRPRLYWTNIPFQGLPENKNILLNDILEHPGFENQIDPKISPCVRNILVQEKDHLLTATGKNVYTKTKFFSNPAIGIEKSCCMRSSAPTMNPIVRDQWNNLRLPSRIERERLQTVPDNYTSIVSNNQAARMLGNGWTVDVIAWFFGFIPVTPPQRT